MSDPFPFAGVILPYLVVGRWRGFICRVRIGFVFIHRHHDLHAAEYVALIQTDQRDALRRATHHANLGDAGAYQRAAWVISMI